MSNQSLAVKYRPTTFADVTEQGNVVKILENQLSSGEIMHAYLFNGGAGTGKTTCARIFANEINHGIGTPTEIDAASNNSVEDVRTIIQQARQKPLDGSEYRVYIMDECHMFSNSAWNAMLKLLEEPPATAIFIFCTTDPQKIPKTILSRVQRYEFQRISQDGIIKRLDYILAKEVEEGNIPSGDHQDLEAVTYIAKLAEGGMRDAITLLDKCLAYSTKLTVENVVAAIGTVNYDTYFYLTDAIVQNKPSDMIMQIERMHASGKDLKLFIRNYTDFILDLCKYHTMDTLDYTKIPDYYDVGQLSDKYFDCCAKLLKMLLNLNSAVRWDNSPKTLIEANLYEACLEAHMEAE